MNARDTKFFKPLWRRVGLVVFCLVWAGWELSNGESFWALISAIIAVYGFWIFFITFDKPGGRK